MLYFSVVRSVRYMWCVWWIHIGWRVQVVFFSVLRHPVGLKLGKIVFEPVPVYPLLSSWMFWKQGNSLRWIEWKVNAGLFYLSPVGILSFRKNNRTHLLLPGSLVLCILPRGLQVPSVYLLPLPACIRCGQRVVSIVVWCW